MKKVRLNKTERDVIIRKIKEAVFKNYEEAKQKVNDSYKPSKEYISVEIRINNIKENLMSLVSENHCCSDYASSLGCASSKSFGKNILEEIKIKELGDKYPKAPNFNQYDIEDALILGGISSDFCIEDFINDWVNKFKY